MGFFETAYQTVLQNYNTLPLSNHNNRPPQDPTNPTDPQVRERGEELLLEKLFFGRSSKSWPEIEMAEEHLDVLTKSGHKTGISKPRHLRPFSISFLGG